MDNFSERVTLEGAGGQTDHTRSTFKPAPYPKFFGAYTLEILVHSGFQKNSKKFGPVLVAQSWVSVTKCSPLKPPPNPIRATWSFFSDVKIH